MMRLILVLLVLSGCAAGARLSEVSEVERVVERLREAMLSGDRAELEALTARDLTYGHSSGLIDDQQSYVESLASGVVNFLSIEIGDQTVQIVNGTAVVRHSFKADLTNRNVPASLDLGVLMVWQKQDGRWKLLARQGFRR